MALEAVVPHADVVNKGVSSAPAADIQAGRGMLQGASARAVPTARCGLCLNSLGEESPVTLKNQAGRERFGAVLQGAVSHLPVPQPALFQCLRKLELPAGSIIFCPP